ncbi:MAG: potassium channel family protein [Anaerolineae bacterium]
MGDFERQLRIALFAFIIIVPLGTFGFMWLEGWSFIDALYVTVITLSTIGYGDLTPLAPSGRIFTIVLAILGLSAFAFAGQAFIQVVTSPALRMIRTRRITQKKIDHLQQHYIICGKGEMVDRTVMYLLQGARIRRNAQRAIQHRPVDTLFDRVFGQREDGVLAWIKRLLQAINHQMTNMLHTQVTLLDILVVITQDQVYSDHLQNAGLLVIQGDPTDNDILRNAGIERAQAMMVMLDDDTETLLTVLTARALVPDLPVTAAVLDEELGHKIVRAGASNVLNPFDISGQFLNNATFRPAVNAFFNGLLFEHGSDYRLISLVVDVEQNGRTVEALNLRQQYDVGVIGIRQTDSTFVYAPTDSQSLRTGDVLLVVVPAQEIKGLEQAWDLSVSLPPERNAWRIRPSQHAPLKSEHSHSLMDAEKIISTMSKHFIICAQDLIARSAIARLDPTRPFVIISNDNTLTSALINRGFLVVHGNPSNEETLIKAGVRRAQAMMVVLEKKADSVLTVITGRALNRHLLITTTANTDDMIDKLELAGADRVVSPFHVAARFILLSATHPELSGYMNAVLYNYQTGLETTEIYTETESVWIGQTIASLTLRERYQAGVIGIRQAEQQVFTYAPPPDYVIQAHEVLIIVTPMAYADAIRDAAYGGVIKAPSTLRDKVLQNPSFTPDERLTND